jgi:hypothetical protein
MGMLQCQKASEIGKKKGYVLSFLILLSLCCNDCCVVCMRRDSAVARCIFFIFVINEK